MLPRSFRTDPARVASLAVGLLALLLIVSTAGLGVMLRNSWRAQQDLLRHGLETSAVVIARALTADSLFFIDAAYDPETGTTRRETLAEYAELPSALALQLALAEVSHSHPELDVAILAPDGGVLVDSDGIHTEEKEPLLLEADRDALETAVQGTAASTPFNSQLGTQRAYYPLRGSGQEVIALLRVTSSAPGAFPYSLIVRRLTIGTLLSAVLIVLLWIMLLRLLRRAREAERAALQGDRLRALGTATAGIAHEIRNPLGIMTLSIEELRASFAGIGDEKLRASIDGLAADLHGEVLRLGKLTNQFLDFTRDDSADDSIPLDLTRAVPETVRLFEKGASSHLKIACRGSEEPVRVYFGENRLRQVLLNLLRNAAEAMARQPTGRIDVTVARAREHAVIEVRDTGPGMDAATLDRVFDPFYTTRPDGSGLGLSLSRSLIDASGGRLYIYSKKGEGTTVRLEFPLARTLGTEG
ncbi:MAG: two-component system, NtrC family, sensor kinase [Candidatus Sumerlaeota bacterium]|nr:two-component system, NtrC family, sensor kinase [Candidatus Sumerlaeota bacterium]